MKTPEPKSSLTITAGQLLDALEMLGRIENLEDRETELTITQMEEWTDSEENQTMPAGLYAYFTEYPEEGLWGPLETHPKPKTAPPDAKREKGTHED